MSVPGKNVLPHYWICDWCAKERGGEPPKGAVTMKGGECPYCEGKYQVGALTPIVDFKWPTDTEEDMEERWD